MPDAPPRRAVFLDRDGVINHNVHYLRRVEDLALVPGAARAIRALNRAGYRVVVVTNQSAVARGWLTVPELEGLHDALRARLAAEGARLDAIYYCPHHPDPGPEGVAAYAVACDCRKPRPGMLLRAARELGLSLADSYLVGDAPSDRAAGEAAGLNTCRLVPPNTADALPDAIKDWPDVAGALADPAGPSSPCP